MKKYPLVVQPKNEIVVYQPNETMRDVQLAFLRYQQQFPNDDHEYARS